MSTLKRYFIHFMVPTYVLWTIVCILAWNSKEMFINTKLTMVIYAGITVYAMLMSLFVTNFEAKYEKVNEIHYCNDNEKNIYLKKIDDITTKFTGKVKDSEDDETIIYKGKNKYTKWLTNEITIYIKNSKIEIYAPKGYTKKFQNI